MDNLNLVSTFAEFKELKNIDKSTMIGVLEDVFRHLLIKTYETDENFDVIINPEKGDLEIWRNRTIVEDGTVENPNQQISLTDARKIDSTYEVGEEVAEEINEILLHRLKNNIRFCAVCGAALPLHHHGRLCEACYRKQRRR